MLSTIGAIGGGVTGAALFGVWGFFGGIFIGAFGGAATARHLSKPKQ